MLKEIQLTENDERRFWTRVDKKSDDECWPWLGYSKSGYGIFEVYRQGKVICYRTNRVSLYIKTREQSEVSRHICDNPICCNPKHLEWGTNLDNVRDKIIRGIQHRKLEDNSVLNIRREFAEGKKCRNELAIEYGVTTQNIRAIIDRKTWRHI